MTSEVNSEHREWWNGSGGRGWVNVQDIVGLALQPFEDLLVERARRKPRRRVLDVGCGTGSTTRAIAEATGADTIGADISETMIAAAEERGKARYVVADAQVHEFEETYDLVVSRFGVMFFDDPVAAFRNLCRATTPGGELCFVTWRSPEENPFMRTASQAAAALLPDLPTPDPDAPGPFSLADPGRTSRILEDAGWTGVKIDKTDLTCEIPEQLLVPYLRNLGPVARALEEAEESERERVIGTVRRAFDLFVDGDEVRFPTGTWLVTASAPL